MASLDDIYVGRQPIYDAGLKVYGYELLFRAGDTDAANVVDGDSATSQVIVNTFMEIGLDAIVGQHLAFINLTRSFFVENSTQVLPPERVILEVLEDIEPDTELQEGLRRLSEQGYRIALDDFIYHESLRPLVELADLVKIDIMDMDRATITEHVEQLKPYKVPLLAEKVETLEEFEFCKQLGFDYFQGYFFCKPNVVKSQRMPSNRLATLRLLSRIQDPQVDAKDLEELIAQDVTLSYKILRYINSAASGLPRQVESIHQAVVLLGLDTIKTWVTLLSLTSIEDKPIELLVTAMVRAKMCEELARAAKLDNTDSYFTVGLFSALDAMMDRPLPELLDELPLAAPVREALLEQEGHLGQALRCVLAYERADWRQAHCASLGMNRVRDAYFTAVNWARGITEELSR